MNANDKIIIYQTSDGQTSIDVKLENETVWLNANQMAALFDRDEKTIRKHINNAIKEELSDSVVVAKFATTTLHGAIKGKVQVHDTNFYNLDVIISVGYRVKSKNGVDFRRWANKILKEYLVKGYAINDKIATQKYEEFPLVYAKQWHPLQSRRNKTHKRRHIGSPHTNDCRKPNRRKRRYGQSGSKPNQPKQLTQKTLQPLAQTKNNSYLCTTYIVDKIRMVA